MLFQYGDLIEQCESRKKCFEQELKTILFRNRRGDWRWCLKKKEKKVEELKF